MLTNKKNSICYLCLNEILFITEQEGNDLLNQRNELISKCRHENKFKLKSHIFFYLLDNTHLQRYQDKTN